MFFAFSTWPIKWPTLSIQRNRDDDFPLMITWPCLGDFSSSTPENRNINRCVLFTNHLLISIFWASDYPVYKENILNWTIVCCLVLVYLANTHCKVLGHYFPILSHPGSSANTSLFCDYLRQEKTT